MNKYSGLYLLIKNEFYKNQNTIYKIGKSDNLYRRVYEYPKSSYLYILILCDDISIHEKNLIKLFKAKFKFEHSYGKEYFSGNVQNMINEIKLYTKNNIRKYCILDFNKGIELIKCYNIDENNNPNNYQSLKNYFQNICYINNSQENDSNPKNNINNINISNKGINNIIIENNLFKCPCGKSFKHRYLLLRHQNGTRGCSYIISLRNVNPENIEYICDICNKRLGNKYSLERHKETCSKKYKLNKNTLNNNNNNNFNLETALQNIINNIKNETEIELVENTIKLMVHIYSDVNKIKILENEINKCKQNNKNMITNSIIKINNPELDIENLVQISGIENPIQNEVINDTIIIDTNNKLTPTPEIIYPLIYPFGSEYISFLTKNEMINILNNPDCLIDILEKIYSRIENKNYYKKNISRTQIITINKNYKIKVFTDREFKIETIQNLIKILKRMFNISKNEIDYENTIKLCTKIKGIDTNYTKYLTIENEKHIPLEVRKLMNAINNMVLTDKETTTVCNNYNLFKHKIHIDSKYKENLMNLLPSINEELENIETIYSIL